MKKITLGLVSYNQASFKYLKYFIPSLKLSLDLALKEWPELDFKIAVFDNSDNDYNHNYDYFKTEKIVSKIFRSETNIGFASAYNQLMQWSLKEGDQLFLMLNPDILVDKNFLKEILKPAFKDKNFAVLAPKIYYWDFSNKTKTRTIDSCGLGLNHSHYFFDRGQGTVDHLNYRDQEEVFGFTGAGALLNLEKIKALDPEKQEFFDEMMFMYKEDVDLSYRLQLAGERIIFIPKAILYHDRSLSKSKSRRRTKARHWSLLNHLIILYKIRRLSFSFKTSLFSKGRCLALFVYALIFDRKAWQEFWRIRKNIKVLKRNSSNSKRIESFMK